MTGKLVFVNKRISEFAETIVFVVVPLLKLYWAICKNDFSHVPYLNDCASDCVCFDKCVLPLQLALIKKTLRIIKNYDKNFTYPVYSKIGRNRPINFKEEC